MITYYAESKKGSRIINEDAYGIFEKGSEVCVVVCDGLGGHEKGEVASAFVVDVVREEFQRSKSSEQFIREIIPIAQEKLLAYQKKEKAVNAMKTTAVVAIITEKKIMMGHIGDARGYLFSKNKIKYRTLDHSIPQMLATAKLISEDEIRNHPERNIVRSVIGEKVEKLIYTIQKPVKRKKGQALLLCTDGFWELIEEMKMLNTLERSLDGKAWLQAMLNEVEWQGADKNMDNYTSVVVWMK